MITKISRDEATGEVLSLRDKLKGEKMGSRFQRAEPPKELKKRLKYIYILLGSFTQLITYYFV
jgi:hypothetical protein